MPRSNKYLRYLFPSAACVICVICGAAQAPLPASMRFHHLHFNTKALQEFYARLFDEAATSQAPVAGHLAIRSGPMLLLFGWPDSSTSTPPSASVAQAPSAIWHVGWGGASLGETYLTHAAREVTWEPPLPAAQLHLHLVSKAPAAAAAWYRDTLGARADIVSGADEPARGTAARPEQRVADAVVSFGAFRLLIYRTDQALVSTRGQRVDHLAFETAELERAMERLRARNVKILDDQRTFDGKRVLLIEGPDRIAIEIVQAAEPAESVAHNNFPNGPKSRLRSLSSRPCCSASSFTVASSCISARPMRSISSGVSVP